jgi:hypothetical protein
MSERRGFVRPIIAFVCLGATALGLNNTYGDNAEVKSLAQKAACGREGCSVTVTRESRSAFSQEFTFQTRLVEKGTNPRDASVDVKCQRAYYLFGAFTCNAVSGGLPGVASSAG